MVTFGDIVLNQVLFLILFLDMAPPDHVPRFSETTWCGHVMAIWPIKCSCFCKYVRLNRQIGVSCEVISPSGYYTTIGIFVIPIADWDIVCVKAFASPVSPLDFIVSHFWLAYWREEFIPQWTSGPLHSGCFNMLSPPWEPLWAACLVSLTVIPKMTRFSPFTNDLCRNLLGIEWY
jgi:hypothetical protein